MFRRFILATTMLLSLAALLSPLTASAADFCWMGSYGRGVGTIPTGCTGGRNLETGMCYTPCKADYQGAVTMCMRNCPSGYTNTGLTCHISKALLIGATVDACNLRTTCPSGYTNAGLLCGLNTPSVPPGYQALVAGPAGSGLDLSREIYDRGIGLAPSTCPEGKVNSGGLCYDKCRDNMNGIGPVCWNKCPIGWVACGMGCARDSLTCGKVVTTQVAGVGMAAGKIAALVLTVGTAAAPIAGTNVGYIAEATAKLNELKKLYEANKVAITVALGTATAAQQGYAIANAVTPEEIAQATATLAGLLDPTGLTSAGAAYVYPTCDKITN